MSDRQNERMNKLVPRMPDSCAQSALTSFPLSPERNVRDRRCFQNPCPPSWLTGLPPPPDTPPPAVIVSGMQSSRCGTGWGSSKAPSQAPGLGRPPVRLPASCPGNWTQAQGWWGSTHGRQQAPLSLSFPDGKVGVWPGSSSPSPNNLKTSILPGLGPWL